jgi:hypothetical protein
VLKNKTIAILNETLIIEPAGRSDEHKTSVEIQVKLDQAARTDGNYIWELTGYYQLVFVIFLLKCTVVVVPYTWS